MQLLKVLYLVVFLGSIGYFFLYGFIMKKLPKITISYEDDYSAYSQKREFYKPLRENSQERAKDALSKDSFRPTSSSLKTFSTTKKNSRDFDQENDESETFLDFLSNFKSKEAGLDDSSPTEDETLYPPTLAPPRDNGVALYKLMKKVDELEALEVADPSVACIQPKRVGRLRIDKRPRISLKMEEAQQELPFVAKGGSWKPTKCQATKVAVVIPFRDRYSHLSTFLKHMHRYLRWQMLDYRIFVIEQSGKRPFNRGMLMNIGFQEAMKKDKYNCVVFHDVDLIPEDDRNDYSCPSSPRHMSTAVDTMKYKLGYKKIFGGVEAFWPEHFTKANGFPNRYWGWGGEDDDLYVRVMKASLGLTRPAQKIGRYYMIKHKKSKGNPERHAMLRESNIHLEKDGLNSLKYKVFSETEHPLYTMIVADVDPKDTSDSWSIIG